MNKELVTKVIIRKDAYEKLLTLAKENSEIVCGLLVGRRESMVRYVTEIREVKTRTSPVIHFKPEWKDYDRIHKEIKGEGKEIVGEFHTHPDGTIELTGRDRVIMYRMRSGFWMIATHDKVSAIDFNALEFKLDVKKIPIGIEGQL